MAESTVKSSIDLLGKVLVEEGKYLWGAEGKVEELRDELLWMRSFLREADTLQYKDEIVGLWVCQIQKYVYEAEDIIDKFVIKVVSRRQQDGMLNKLKRYSCIFREFYDLHQAASSIDSLTVKISTLSPKLEKYGLMRTLGKNIDEAKETRIDQIQHIMKNVYMEDQKIVGFDKNVKEIINVLKRTTPKKGFHAIYNMGGSGKTTLATKVFKDEEMKQDFFGGQAFAYVSKKFQVESVLQDLLDGLGSGSVNNNATSRKKSKIHALQEILKTKKCLVVLDDVWTKEAWDSLKPAFTSCGADSGSKVLLTTRKEDVANYVDHEALHKPDPLTEDESWELLQLTMGSCSSNEQATSEIDGEERKLKEKIFKVYKGLPLAIVVLGGILRKKQTWAERNLVLETRSSHLIKGYDHGRSCMEIVLLSYNDLPYHLKPCFLHLAQFPEDYEIKTENLYWMWIAEGLVTRSSDRRAGTKSLEDVANEYLSDLVQAGLVEIDEVSEGWIESVRMHDLVRDVCVEEASCNNLLKTIDLRSCPDEQLDTYDYYGENRLLRMAIYLPRGFESSSNFIKDSVSSKASKYLRSLLFIFGLNVDAEVCEKVMRCICSEFGMLRVLVLGENFKLTGRLSSQIEKLMHLRYLSLKGARLIELPSSIGNLRFLEILDLRGNYKLRMPNTLWKLFRLRHLLLPDDYEIKRSKRLRVDKLISLETIENLLVEKLRSKDMLGIKKLRRLSVEDVVSKKVFAHIIPALKSGRLRSCSLEIKGDVISNNTEVLSMILCKCELTIRGRISLKEGKKFEVVPQYLEVLTLHGCELKDDPMQILGSLSHLKTLKLDWNCYGGKKMSCNSQSFPLLTRLNMNRLSNLEEWEVEHGSMPKLNWLYIMGCTNLNRMPHVLPLSLKVFSLDIDRKIRHLSLDYDKVVLLVGKSGLQDMPTCVEEFYCSPHLNRCFDVVVRAWILKRCIGNGNGGALPIPRRILQRLLRDLNPKLSIDKDLSKMSYDTLIAHIQDAMKTNKCLVILMISSDVLLDHLKELDRVFGCEGTERRSQLLVISQSDEEPDVVAEWHVRRFQLPTQMETWGKLSDIYGAVNTNAGIKWNLLRPCLGHSLLAEMLWGLLKRKKKLREWSPEHKDLTDSSFVELSWIFALCYNDLQPQLRRCLILLAKFPEDEDISTKKLYQMWMAAGYIQSNSLQEEGSLEDVALTYLTELVDRAMVTAVKRGPDNTIKTCQLKFALRDLLLAKATEEDDRMVTLDEQLRSLVDVISSPTTSLLFVPDISVDPLNNDEEKWEWLLHVCNNFQSLRILDLQGVWMTKGSLPTEVGKLTELRYLSLRGTRVTEIPPSSIKSLTNLQTLDLRVSGSSLIIPDILWKLGGLMHLHLPDLIRQDAPELRLSGLSCLRTLLNLHTHKVRLSDLADLKLLSKISIKKIHAVEELDDVLGHLSTDLEVSINSDIINDDQTILSRFRNLHKLKIKGTIWVELRSEMFPTHLKELTMKHTKFEEDPLPILEKLSELKKLVLEHESFLGKEMTFSKSFHRRTKLIWCSLNNLEKLFLPERWSEKVDIIDCWRVRREDHPRAEEEELNWRGRRRSKSVWTCHP